MAEETNPANPDEPKTQGDAADDQGQIADIAGGIGSRRR
jgi:hypothetical protein